MTDAPLVCVCGPIGVGKSTVVSRLAQMLGFGEWPEAVDQNPFFTRYLRDRSTWALRSQLAFMLTAVENAARARREPVGAVLERPVQEMFGVFVGDLHRERLLDDDELATLGRLVDLGERVAGTPDLLILLHGDPQRMLQRIRVRARPGEEAYDLADMMRLDGAYRDWVGNWGTRCPIIERDTTEHDLRRDDEMRRLTVDVRRALGLAR